MHIGRAENQPAARTSHLGVDRTLRRDLFTWQMSAPTWERERSRLHVERAVRATRWSGESRISAGVSQRRFSRISVHDIMNTCTLVSVSLTLYMFQNSNIHLHSRRHGSRHPHQAHSQSGSPAAATAE